MAEDGSRSRNRQPRPVYFRFDGGSIELLFAGYEIGEFAPGGMHDWLVGTLDLRYEASGKHDRPPPRPDATVSAANRELTVGAEELSGLRDALHQGIARSSARLDFVPFEQDVELTIHFAESPTIDVLARFGYATVALHARAITWQALADARDALSDLLKRLPARGTSS